MLSARLSLLAFLAVAATGCRSTSYCEACDDAQAVVERVARENPAVTRLSVHCPSADGMGMTACASTSMEKRGTKSDPEDMRAMQTGQAVVMDEGRAVDVTVPILSKDGRYMGACGVTMEPNGMSREQTVERAKTIAMAVEAGVKNCGDCCCTEPK